MDQIVRIAAKGDGATASGRHYAGAAPEDWVAADGTLMAGPHRAAPPCPHFRADAAGCGGCQLQHIDEPSLGRFVTDRVVNAARGQGLEPAIVHPPHLSPAGARRRATLHAIRGNGRIILGFRQAASHRIIDLAQCPVLHPALAGLIAPLRGLLSAWPGAVAADITLALTDQGVDCGVRGLAAPGLAATEALLSFAAQHRLARLTLDQGYGPEALWEPEPLTVALSGTPVPFPAGGFLQPTADGEAELVRATRDWLAGAPRIADLFAGLGTFAFGLARQGAKVLALEADRAAAMACQQAANRSAIAVKAIHRDLFRNPLRGEELAAFAGVVLDPPRAGAREQVARLAGSAVARIVYVSCNPGSWARDAAALVAGGYRLAEVRPVGQFRWSTHVELVSLFTRVA